MAPVTHHDREAAVADDYAPHALALIGRKPWIPDSTRQMATACKVIQAAAFENIMLPWFVLVGRMQSAVRTSDGMTDVFSTYCHPCGMVVGSPAVWPPADFQWQRE